MQYFSLKRAKSPWGDYGDVLRHGFLQMPKESSEPIRLRRTGPFVPPISFPNFTVVVTADVRALLERQRFTGLSFKPVSLVHVERLDWRSWDQDAEEPTLYPETGEPEDYVFRAAHDPSVLREMPKLWAWDVPSTPNLQVHGTGRFRQAIHPGTDVAREFYIHWVSQRCGDWLATHLAEWVDVAPTKPA